LWQSSVEICTMAPVNKIEKNPLTKAVTH